MATPAAKQTLSYLAGKTFLVTGGGGYVGNRIVLALLRNNAAKVLALDLRFPKPESIPSDVRQLYKDRAVQIEVDLRNKEAVWKVLDGVDLVVHTASFGMSGRDMLLQQKVREINVGGTQNLLEGCAALGVVGLVYTSSANVVFSGRYEMPDLGEDVPYNRLEDCVDEYSRTKCMAEQLVVGFNGMSLHKKNATLSFSTVATCAVRPAAIYGEGEERHFPRIVSIMEKGQLIFNIGDPSSMVDWVHVDNLVYGHVLAAAKLLSPHPADRELVGGKAYYISDKKPMNNFVFMRPLIEGLGYKFPTVWIPFKVMFNLAHLVEIVHGIVSPIIPFEPFLNRAEVCKVGVTHYFRTDKAERELGWSLVISPEEGVNKMVKYWQDIQEEKKKKAPKKREKDGNSGFLLIVLFVLALAILATVYWK